MMPHHKILREYIKKIIEGAISAPQAGYDHGLVIVEDDPTTYTLVMFNTALVQNMFNEDIMSVNSSQMKSMLEKTITGYVMIIEDVGCGAWEIVSAAAEHGFGPLMYDLAMSFVKNTTGSERGWVIADRKSTSAEAKGVWLKYFEMRSDVEKVPIDPTQDRDNYYPRSGDDPPKQSCVSLNRPEFLNHKYQIKTPISYSHLTNKANQVIDQVSQIIGWDKQAVREAIDTAGVRFFMKKYHG